jgi:hypothetical protein
MGFGLYLSKFIKIRTGVVRFIRGRLESFVLDGW